MILVANPLILPDDERRTGLVRVLSPVVLSDAIAHLVVRQVPGGFRPFAGVSVADRPGTGLKTSGIGQLVGPAEQGHTDHYLTGIGAHVQPTFHHVVLNKTPDGINMPPANWARKTRPILYFILFYFFKFIPHTMPVFVFGKFAKIIW